MNTSNLSTRDQQKAAFCAAGTVGTSGRAGAKAKGNAKAAGAENCNGDGVPAKHLAGQTGKKRASKGKSQTSGQKGALFQSRERPTT